MGYLQGELDFYAALQNLHQMPKQKEFIGARQFGACYCAGQGSGKSVALCTSAILNSAAEPNGFSLIGRLNMPALESTTMKTFLEMVPEAYGEWLESKKIFRFYNGHEVIFKHLEISDPKVVGHIRSMNLSAVYVDEASEVGEEVYFLLIGRLRRQTAKRHVIRLSSNPAGHDWMWRHFFDPDRKPELLASNLGITASTMDNPFLPPEYVQNMLNTYPEDWAQRFIYGSFSDFSDLVYKDFSERTHVWRADHSYAVFGGSNLPPKEWPVVVGIDIGSDIDPWAIACIAVSPDGTLYQYAEVYGNCMLIADIASQLQPHLEGRKVSGVAYDYSNRQCALELAEYGIHGTAAIKEVQPGLFKTSQYIHIDQRLGHPFNRELHGASRFFVSSACKNTLRELGAYKWGKDRSGNATGEPAHDYSHSCDAIRYAIHSFRPLPAKLQAPKSWENPQLDALSRLYWMERDLKKDKMAGIQTTGAVPKTVQEWQRQANQKPVRFQRAASVRFSRA